MRGDTWKLVRHPIKILLKGWRRGGHRYHQYLTSPRGTVFVIRKTERGIVARKFVDFMRDDLETPAVVTLGTNQSRS